jgi:hypothetical protein
MFAASMVDSRAFEYRRITCTELKIELRFPRYLAKGRGNEGFKGKAGDLVYLRHYRCG